ncbi:MAG TPA: GyrI-like domain-containing protein [Acidimicrobiales bacterium]|nr:GyrI-like domain-containing protein [Acidimicrobiales bacterium]
MVATACVSASHVQLYRAKVGTPEFVQVPAARFLMVDGHGDPESSKEFAQAVQALYAGAYTIKFALYKEGAPDERIAPLEGLWWGGEAADFAPSSKGGWHWTMMIRVPDAATDRLIAGALVGATSKRPDLALDRVRCEQFAEGLAAQVMHVGPYAEEGPAIAALHRYIAEHGYRRVGRHHEIYFGDPRRADPAQLKTLLRQPAV